MVPREQVELLTGLTKAEYRGDDLVGESSDLRPLSCGIEQIMSELAAIAVSDRDQQISAIVGRAQLDFRDARKIFADDVSVGTGRRTDLVKIDLLVEIGVLSRTLIALRIAGVVEAGRIFVPGHVATRRWELDTRHDIREGFTGRDFEYMHRTVFTPVFG